MIKVNIEKNKKENPYIEHFAKDYLVRFYPNIQEVNIGSPDDDSKYTAADYLLKEPNVLVEIKEIHDYSSNQEMGIFSGSMRWLRDELEKRDLSWVGGSFIIETHMALKIRREDKGKIIDQLLQAIKEQKTNISIDNVGGFKIRKINNKENHVFFSASGGVRSIDPVSTIYENIYKKINTADNQLGSYREKVAKKILLLVNQYIFADPRNVVEALSRHDSELVKYKNIDEIWLIFRDRDKEFLPPELIYTKDFLAELAEAKFEVNPINIKLLEKWFYSLEKANNEYKEKLFLVMKHLFTDKKPCEIVKDDSTREQMVQIGIWLAQKERFEDAAWIVKKFIDDTDPGKPEDYIGDPDFNYHEEIIKGKDTITINTVLGHLAWVIQKLCVKEEYIFFALENTKKLLEHPNLYVRLQGIIPLTEIAARRQWLKGWNQRPYVGEYKIFHDLCFGLIDLLEKNKNYVAIADSTTYLFSYYKDLTTEESIRVLNALKINNEAAGLFVYFGIFRARHYKDVDIPFDAAKLSLFLKDILKSKNESDSLIIASIGWHFWKLLSEQKQEFNELKPYIDLLFDRPYSQDLHGNIEMIIEDWIGSEVEISIKWFNQYLDNIIDYLKAYEDIRSNGGLWLSLEPILESIAKNCPSALIKIIPKVTKICKKGGYVGYFNKIFQTYKLIEDEDLKKQVKELSKNLYQTIEADYPRVDKMDW
jgi:hypothetical protein